jgi:putative transposase
MRKPKANANIVYDCQYHVVWCPKYRRKVLQYGVDVRLKEIIQEVASEKKAIILEMEIMPDHVHLLIAIEPQFGIHKLIKFMKGRSSRYLRQEFPW